MTTTANTILCPRCAGTGQFSYGLLSLPHEGETCPHCSGSKRVEKPELSEDDEVILAIASHFEPALVDGMFSDAVIARMGFESFDFDGTRSEHTVLDWIQCVLLGIPESVYEDIECHCDDWADPAILKEEYAHLFRRLHR